MTSVPMVTSSLLTVSRATTARVGRAPFPGTMPGGMTRRVNSELLLVGSLPAESTDAAFRAGAELFADLVFALPDGETGPRAAWVGYEREQLTRPNPDVVVLEETESPTGIPRHAYETPVFGIRDGVSELKFDSWPRIDDAITSYRRFRGLRGAGGLPSG